MKIPINLASQPFRRDRAMLVASARRRALLVALAWPALLSSPAPITQQLAGLRHEVAQPAHRSPAPPPPSRPALEAILHKPENARCWSAASSSTTCIYHKGISWSRIFADLEKTMPYNVKVLNIHP